MHARGAIRDAIADHLSMLGTDASLESIHAAVAKRLGPVPQSSVRSYLNLNVGKLFERTGRGHYRMRGIRPGEEARKNAEAFPAAPVFVDNRAKLYHADCFAWLARQPEHSIHAVVTDPPYGLVEYTAKEQEKLHGGRGGVWRIPPAFDGHRRSPLPRFTVLDQKDRDALRHFFMRLAVLLRRATVPGANVVVASNPLLAHVVAGAMAEGGSFGDAALHVGAVGRAAEPPGGTGSGQSAEVGYRRIPPPLRRASVRRRDPLGADLGRRAEDRAPPLPQAAGHSPADCARFSAAW